MLSLGYIWMEFVRKLRVCWETAQPLPHVRQEQQQQQRSSLLLDDSQQPQQGQGLRLNQQPEGQGLRLWERALWQDVIDSAGVCRL